MSIPVTFRIDEAQKAKLDAVARELDRPASYILSQALDAYLQFRQDRIDDLREAVSEAENGVFISNSAIHAWLESLDSDSPKPFPSPDILPSSP